MIRVMKREGMGLAVATAILTSLVWTSGAGAQSLTSVQGLGYPKVPVDARSEILGGLGIGLGGFAMPLTSPASGAHVQRRGFVLAIENTNRSITLGDETGETGATRFPLLRAILPVRGVVLSAGYGGVLDQSWGVTASGESLIGTGDVLPYQETIASTGGVGQMQVGAAMPVGERFAVGASVGALTGNQRIRLTRRFDDTTAVSDFQPFDETFGWRYSGLTASAGAEWQVPGVAQAGASVTWSGTVSADSTDGRAGDREYDLPLQVAGGASAYLGPTLLAAVSTRWSGWSASEPGGAGGMAVGEVLGARDTWEIGGGLELDNPESRETRHYPVRVGFQYRQLPFTFLSDAPSEWLVGAGVGVRWGTDPTNPAALVDLAVQRGSRTAAGNETFGDFEEELWRVSLSISLFGN